MTRRVLVTGPRDYADRAFVWSKLDALHAEEPIGCIIQGEATGADAHAKAWALHNGVPTADYPAKWSQTNGIHCRDLHIKIDRRGRRYNALAGFARNTEMLRDGCPTHVVGFPDPRRCTPGTCDMLGKAHSAAAKGQALEVLVYRHPTDSLFYGESI